MQKVFKKGDIVRNTSPFDSALYKYQIIIGTYNGNKGVTTIDYMGCSHSYDEANEHMEVVGHSKEYDAYMESLKNLLCFDVHVNNQEGDEGANTERNKRENPAKN